MGFSTATSNSLLDLKFGAVAYTPPGTYWVGLSSTEPADAGTNVTEPSGGSYARQAIANTLTGWVSAAGGEKTNALDIVYTVASASWGAALGWWVLYNAVSGGTMEYWGVIPIPRVVGNSDVFTIPAGDIVIALISG